jgi:hypothetical protein
MSGWRKRTIMELAREAGIRDCTCSGAFGCLDAFAALVREDERNRTWTQEHWTEYERSIAATEREACANTAGLALLGADKALSDRVLKAIRARGKASSSLTMAHN